MSYYMWDTCTSHFGPKKIDRVGRGGQGRSKYCPEWAPFFEHVEIIIAYKLDLDSIKLIPRNEFLDPIYLCTTPN